jgi:hypothetical protein
MKFFKNLFEVLSYSWLDKGIVLTVLLGGFGYIVMNVLIEIFLVLPLI